jgi:MYXO-CTERM domain-containing protein
MRRAVALLVALGSGSAIAAPNLGRPQLLRADRGDLSAPLLLLSPTARAGEPGEEEEERGPRPVPHEMQAAPPAHDPVLQDAIAPLAMPRTSTSFDGIGLGFTGPNAKPFKMGVPPDAQGDVGPSHYVQIVNLAIIVFAKDGRPLLGPVPTRTLFAGFGTVCETHDDGDGIVLYDPLANRWLITQLANDPGSGRPYHVCMAVSQTGDPMGQWARYDYSYVDFHDYPKWGVWPDAYYLTANVFATLAGDHFRGISYCAFDRAKMLAGDPSPGQQCILIHDDVSGITPADLDGTLPPPAGDPNTAVGFSRGALILYRYRLDWNDPTGQSSFVEPTSIPVAPFAEACAGSKDSACIPQPASGASALDSLGDRIMFRAAYRNLGGHESLVVNHSVMAGGVTGVRWYEIRDPAGNPYLYQQGTYAPDDSFRWMGSAAIDRAGNIGLGFSVSSPGMRPAIGYTGHVVSDAPGEMGQGEAIAASSGGSQANSTRWGDYSSMSVDPVDECTFWYTNQYIPADGLYNWRTRIFSFQLPGCAASPDYAVWPALDVQALGRGYTAAVRLNTAPLRPSASGKPLVLTVVNVPAGVSARTDPPVVAAGDEATLLFSAAPGAALGRGQGYSVIATAADGAAVSTSGALDVADSDFSLELERSEVLVAAGATTRLKITTAPLFGSAEVVALSASGVRSGVTASFDPPRIVAGQTSTLLLTGATGLPPGNAALTITGDAISTSHRAALHVRALEAPRAEITWPGPQNSLSGNVEVIANAITSPGTTLVGMELMVDGQRVRGVLANTSPATLSWDTRMVDDGPHDIVVRATDDTGGTGESTPVDVVVRNKGSCGCSAGGGGWEALGLFALLASVRRRRR